MSKLVEKFGCRTVSGFVTSSFEFKWEIEKELIEKLYNEEIESLKSATFELKSRDGSFYFQIRKSFDDEYLLLKLVVTNSNEDLLVMWNYTLKAKEDVNDYKSFDDSWGEPGLAFEEFLKQDDFEEGIYLIDGFLVIICEGEVKCKTMDKLYTSIGPINEDPLDQSMLTLLQSGAYSDVTFNVAGKSFKAHRNILVTRCKYFEAIFEGGFQESTSPEFEIIDVEPDVFAVILHFIYTGALPDSIGIIAKEVFVAADKYDLQPLVAKCVDLLCNGISLNNCVEYLVLANSYNQDYLEKAVVAFIKQNIKMVVVSEAWKELKQTNHQLAYDIIEESIKKELTK